MRLSLLCLLTAVAGAAPAQDYQAFRAAIEQRLKQHAFFSRITFTLIDKPPFLFCIERAANGEKDYEIGIANSYLPYLREVQSLFEEFYVKDNGLARRAEAGGFALAVLSSAGRYVDFRTAIGDPSLAMARAHYTPDLQLAVTYVDTFARYNTNSEERHAVLHEFVHALQHAYSADGKMPKPVWFNEGLAEYRASGTNVTSSLREPPLSSTHVDSMAFAYANPRGRAFVTPVAELVTATSYKEILDLAKKRLGGPVPDGPFLSMYYAQAEMFVRFLHEAEQGKYRPGFLKYVQAAQRGEAGLEAFTKALGVDGAGGLAALERDWLKWLDSALRPTYPTIPDLTKGDAASASGARVPMPPPTAFDTAALDWTKADLADRFAAVRRLCARGGYETAQALLPAASDLAGEEQAYAARERPRIEALIKLRDDVLADLVQTKGVLSVTLDSGAVKGKVQRRDDDGVVVLVGKTETKVPLTAVAPAVLLAEGRRLKRFEGKERWLEVWTRWLKGDPLKALQDSLALGYSTLPDLRKDLTSDFDAVAGGAGAALVEVLRLPTTDDAESAARSLARLQELLATWAKAPLFERRTEPLKKLVRCYAERAFKPDDVTSLGVRGATKAGNGVAVDYRGPKDAPAADFTPVVAKEREDLLAPEEATQLTHTGPSGLIAAGGAWNLVGSAWLRWAVPLRGQQVVEIEFVVRGDWVPDFSVGLCVRPGGMLLVNPTGSVEVYDVERRVADTVGGGAQLTVDETVRLRIEHDGARKLTVSIDGKQTASVGNVGRLTSGDLVLRVHTSTPVEVRRISVRGIPDPSDPGQLRERYVTALLQKLWP